MSSCYPPVKRVSAPEILENIAQHMIVVQSDTTSRFKGMAPGLYILSEDFLTVPYEEDEEDDVAVFVRPEKHLFVVTGSGVLEVELDEEDFSLIEKRHVYKKRRLHELREQEETEINLKDLEVVREKAEGQPLKKTRWFGPAIDEYQVPKGSIAKKKDEERNSFPDDEPFELD